MHSWHRQVWFNVLVRKIGSRSASNHRSYFTGSIGLENGKMSNITDDGGGRWKAKTWNYLIGLGVTIAIAVLITLYCLTRHLYESIRRHRRRRRVRVIYVLGAEDEEYTNESHLKPHGTGSSTTNPLETKHSESSSVQVEPSLPAIPCAKSSHFANNNETQFGICNALKQSPSSILNNNFLDYANNNVLVYNVDLERPSANNPATGQTGSTTRVVIGSGIMSGVMGPAYQFLMSLIETDASPVVTNSNTEDVAEEINRLTTTGRVGLISMLDLCQAEGNQHDERIPVNELPQNISSSLQRVNENSAEVGSNESVYPPLRGKEDDENRCQCC